MKKTLIIILGVVVFLLIGGWIYLLLNGAPENIPGINTNFQVNPSTPSDFEESGTRPEENAPTRISLDRALTKLTTAPVAGAVFLKRDGETFIRYAERGTAHVFEISLTTGTTERITVTTIPKTVDVVWATSGARLAVTTETAPYTTETFVASITKDDRGNNALDGFVLPENAENIFFNEAGDTLFYTLSSETTTGYEHDLKTDEVQELFTLPFSQAHVLWSDASSYVYTKPSGVLEGYLYRVEEDKLTRITKGVGLMTKIHDPLILVSTAVGERLESLVFDTASSTEHTLSVGGYPEKCTFSFNDKTVLWCAAPIEFSIGSLNVTHPDDWYQGTVTFDDQLWQLDVQSGNSARIDNLGETAGEVIDATDLVSDNADSYLLFVNKRDGTLWLYDLNAQP